MSAISMGLSVSNLARPEIKRTDSFRCSLRQSSVEFSDDICNVWLPSQNDAVSPRLGMMVLLTSRRVTRGDGKFDAVEFNEHAEVDRRKSFGKNVGLDLVGQVFANYGHRLPTDQPSPSIFGISTSTNLGFPPRKPYRSIGRKAFGYSPLNGRIDLFCRAMTRRAHHHPLRRSH